jgi:hypothetical protein
LVFALFALKHSNIKIGGRKGQKWWASGREAEFRFEWALHPC